jgi:hypothetical protein
MSFLSTTTVIIGGIFTIYLCFYIIRKSKIYDKAFNILIKMAKILEKKPKKPSNLNSFWKLYSDEHKELKEDIESLKSKFKDIKKHNYSIPIIAVLLSIGIMSATLVINYLDVIDYFVSKPIINVYDSIYRYNDTQSYKIVITNSGNVIAYNLDIKIEFDTNMSIFKIKHDEGAVFNDTGGGVDSYFYNFEYPKINENDTVYIQLLLHNKVGDFKLGESWVVEPTKKAWINGKELTIERI